MTTLAIIPNRRRRRGRRTGPFPGCDSSQAGLRAKHLTPDGAARRRGSRHAHRRPAHAAGSPFFIAQQQQRLAEPMEQWRAARAAQEPLPPGDQGVRAVNRVTARAGGSQR
jgi:hypothetical protein